MLYTDLYSKIISRIQEMVFLRENKYKSENNREDKLPAKK